jgi:hypothetical protein
MIHTKVWTWRTIWAPVEGEPNRKRSAGEEWYWKDIIIPEAARLPEDEVVVNLGEDKRYILAKIDEMNRQMDLESLLNDARQFSPWTIVRRTCLLDFRGKINNSEDVRRVLNISDEEIKSHLFKGKWAVVTRSFMPPQGTPWKRFGSRTYCWVVPMAEAFEHKGRRIEWGGDTTPFNSRKEALAFLYKG